MKKTILTLVLVFGLAAFAAADRIALTTPEVLEVPTATQLDWQIILIDAKTQTLQVQYRWLDADGKPIHAGSNQVWKIWTCKNEPDNPETVEVDPKTCFSDVFAFHIRPQDAGTSIGIGLRTLIWNQMRQDILTTGNTGTFE